MASERDRRWLPAYDRSVVVVRAPVLPYDTFEELGRGLSVACDVLEALARGAPPSNESVEEGLRRDRAVVREKLRALASRPDVREAIFVASASLDERLDGWLRAARADEAIEAPLFRYVTRMSARAMAFGLFAGTILGKLGDHTDLTAVDGRFERTTEVDFWTAHMIALALERRPEVRRHLSYRVNPTLFTFGTSYRFLAVLFVNGIHDFQTVLVERDAFTEAIRACAESGFVSFERLVAIVTDRGVALDDAMDYVLSLIDEQFLVGDVTPPPSHDAPIDWFLRRLEAIPEAQPIVTRLREVRQSLRALDSAGGSPSRWREALAPLADVPGSGDPMRAYRTTLFKSSPEVTIGRAVMRDIVAAMEFLRRTPIALQIDEVTAFARKFEARYEQREVPLLEALDPDVGVGFGVPVTSAPLVAGLPTQTVGHGRTKETWDEWTQTLFRKLLEATRTGATVIELTDDDAPGGKDAAPAPMPDVFDILVRLGRRSDSTGEADDDGYTVQFMNAFGPQTAIVTSRFAYDERTKSRLRSALSIEEEGNDALVAEVVHTVRGHGANALIRPVLRPYEIPCPDRASVDDDHVIPLSDIVVSVRKGRVRLRSLRHDRWIEPRLTNAHVIEPAPCVPYRFLSFLARAHDQATFLEFTWDVLGDGPFVPRVVYRNVVLKRATWRIDAREIAALTDGSEAERFVALQRIRSTRNLPRHVVVTDADQELILDLDSPLSFDALATAAAGKKSLRVQEVFPAAHELAARGPSGRFVTDARITVARARAPVAHAAAPPARPSATASDSAQRAFPLGSEWLYVKLYAGPDAATDVVRRFVAPFAREHAALFEGCFFLFYGDPDWHVRVRFRGPRERLAGELLPALAHSLDADPWRAIVPRWSTDTYVREVERYGGARGVALAEDIFCADSAAALAVWEEDFDADTQWRVALLGIARLMADLGLSRDDALATATATRDALRTEFAKPNELDHALGRRYRTHRAAIEALLDGREQADAFVRARTIFDARSKALAPIAAALATGFARGEIAVPRDVFVDSQVHMSVARLLPRANRAHEFALIDFLVRAFTTARARERSRR